jgi:hypothetical protein
MGDYILFDTDALIPSAWRHLSASGPVRAFNPALLPDGSEFIFAYRIVGPDGLRRIALCRLDARMRVVLDSQIALTDHVKFPRDQDLAGPAATWFADPRLYRFGSRVFIYWNSGWHEPRNYQFLQELDPASFRPIGQPRELVLRGPRQALEKNWTFFGTGPFFAVYSIAPHRVLTFSVEGTGDIEFTDAATRSWPSEAYTNAHGPLRGGAPPQLLDDHFWSFCHTVNGGEGNYRYAPAVYRFAAAPPFAPTDAPATPIVFGAGHDLSRRFPKLNPAVGEVIYPCGAAYREGRWLVSHGVNDERCAIAVVPHAEVVAAVRPIERAG